MHTIKQHFNRSFYVLCSTKVKTCLLILLISAVVSLLISCDPLNRYKVLTFFFDGVPPLGGAGGGKAAGELLIESGAGEAGVGEVSLGQAVVSRHKAARDCRRCHEDGTRWSRKQLHNPLPQLCYECHTDYNVVRGYVHGPVAVGACAFCHDSHQSNYLRLQRSPQPDLCYQCHDIGDISSLVDHQDQLEGVCTECHDPHVSSGKMLLKPHRKNQQDADMIIK